MDTKDILTYHRYGGSRGRSPQGSLQTAISARIDNTTMTNLDMEAAASGLKRNAIINLAIKWYIQELDDARRYSSSNVYTKDRTQPGATSHERLLNMELTCGELKKLSDICRKFGTNVDDLTTRLVRKMLEEYDKNT